MSNDTILRQFMHPAYLGAKGALQQPEIGVGIVLFQEFGNLLSAKALKYLTQEVNRRLKLSA